MNRLRRFAIATLAAATVTTGSLVIVVPTASAQPMSCTVRYALAEAYIATGNVFFGLGDNQRASYWYGRAQGVLMGCS
jgi:hypothetical protein